MNTSRDPAVPEVPIDLLNPALQLVIRNLSKTYPNGTQALNDVSLSPQGVAQGTVLFGGLFGLLVSAALFGDAAIRDVTSGMDPLGINALLAMTRYWTPVEMQTRLLGFPAMLPWLVIALYAGELVWKDREVGTAEIGVFAPGEGGGPGKPLYLERHRILSGGQTIRITVPREPGRAGIDPWRKLIDRDREDNVVEVQAVEMETSR